MRVSLFAVSCLVFAGIAAPAAAADLHWSAPQTITSPGVSLIDSAIDDAGDAIVVYAIGSRVYAESRPAGGTFGAAQLLTGSGGYARVAMAADGTAIAAWHETSGAIAASVRPPGGTFGSPTVLGHGTIPSNPDARVRLTVMMNRAGHGAVAWHDGASVLAARRRPGAAFEPPVALDAETKNVEDELFGMDAAGDVTIVWSQDTPTGGPAPVEAYSGDLPRSGDAWTTAKIVDTLGEVLKLGVGPDGTAALTFGQTIPSRTSFRAPGGAWTEPAPLLPNGQYAAPAVDAEGRVHFFYYDGSHPDPVWQSRERLPDGTLTTPQPVAAVGGPTSLALDSPLADGGDLLTWRSDSQPLMRTALRAPDGSVTPTDLSVPGSGGIAPDVAVSPDGHAIIVGTHFGATGAAFAWVRDTAWPTEPDRSGGDTRAVTPTPAPAPPVDRVAPTLATRYPHHVKRSTGSLRIKVTPSEAASLTLTGSVDPRGRARSIKLKRTVTVAAARRPSTLVVTFPRRLRAALRHAHGGTAHLAVTATDAAANRRTTRLAIKLV